MIKGRSGRWIRAWVRARVQSPPARKWGWVRPVIKVRVGDDFRQERSMPCRRSAIPMGLGLRHGAGARCRA